MTTPEEYEKALTALLVDSGRTSARVRITGTASLGTQRATLYVDIDIDMADGAEPVRAVAQIKDDIISSAPTTQEAALLRLAASAGAPVPQVLAATDSLPGIGQPALVTARVDGLSIPRQILRSLTDSAAGDQLAAACGEALARIHAIDTRTLPAELDRLSPIDPYNDYSDRLEETLDELPVPYPAIRLGINWLRRNPPPPAESPTLVHGDFRNGNILVSEGRLEAVLDWELSHVGDPMEDLAYLCMRTWRFGNDSLICGGFGSLVALQSAYEASGGTWRDDAFHWWSVARSVWWATGLAQQAAAFSRGDTDSIVLAASGRRVPELEYDLLNLISPKSSKER